MQGMPTTKIFLPPNSHEEIVKRSGARVPEATLAPEEAGMITTDRKPIDWTLLNVSSIPLRILEVSVHGMTYGTFVFIPIGSQLLTCVLSTPFDAFVELVVAFSGHAAVAGCLDGVVTGRGARARRGRGPSANSGAGPRCHGEDGQRRDSKRGASSNSKYGYSRGDSNGVPRSSRIGGRSSESNGVPRGKSVCGHRRNSKDDDRRAALEGDERRGADVAEDAEDSE